MVGDRDLREMGSKEKRAASQGSGKRSSNKINRAIRLQYSVLPYRFTETNSLEVLLVTTRQTRRWIIPKGWPIKGLKPPKSAARVAYEEAGIRGTVAAKSVGGVLLRKTPRSERRERAVRSTGVPDDRQAAA